MTNDKKNFSRREFLNSSVSGIASLTVLNLTEKAPPQSNKVEPVQDVNQKIIYRTLGKTKIKLPVVSMGVMNSFDPALVRRAYQIGVRHFDTAAWYQRGRNEEMVGNVIKELNARDQVIIGTKIYIPLNQRNITPGQAKETYLKIAEESLKRLQTDYIDILYSHDVSSLEWLNNPGILEALQLLKQQGKARFIGFSTHSNIYECVQESTRTDNYDVILTAFNYGMNEDKKLLQTLKKAAAKGIGLIAMKTQCTQYHYRQYVSENNLHYYKGKMTQTAVLKWALRHNFITTAVPGYTNFQQMDEDFSVAYNLDYTDEEKKFLQDRNVKYSLGYCLQCKHCVATCPRGVDIPMLMRTHMYATCYRNFFQARDALDSIASGKDLQACGSCHSCSARCINNINIGSRIDELKVIYT